MKNWRKEFRMFIAGLIYPGDRTINDLFEKLAKSYDANSFHIINGEQVYVSILDGLKVIPMYVLPKKHKVYYAIPESLLYEFNRLYSMISLMYQPDVLDCDNFAVDYMAQFLRFARMIPNVRYGFAVGLVYGEFGWVTGKHQCNILVMEGWLPMYIEPQDFQTYSLPMGKPDMIYL